MNILITGIAGFYGHHLAKYLMDNTDWNIVGIDRIDESSSLDRLKEIGFHENKRCKFIFHDLRSAINPLVKHRIGDVDIIFHLAAASHVDRSIQDPMSFVLDNVVGTTNTLEFARTIPGLRRFIYFSTDEVFGSALPNEDGTYRNFKEEDRFRPGNPYSASKAAGECMAMSYENTYKTPVIITRCMNILGERQHVEKYLPKLIRKITSDEQIMVYSDKTETISGDRHYIYVDHVSEALLFILKNGEVGEKYNIEAKKEISNLYLAQLVAQFVGKKLKYKMLSSDVVRPGNDFAYGIDGSKLRELGFEYEDDIIERVRKVVNWYLDNPEWYKL